MILRTGTQKSYRIWFLPTSWKSSCGISQGEIVSVNWLLCYRFFQNILSSTCYFTHRFQQILMRNENLFWICTLYIIFLQFNQLYSSRSQSRHTYLITKIYRFNWFNRKYTICLEVLQCIVDHSSSSGRKEFPNFVIFKFVHHTYSRIS